MDDLILIHKDKKYLEYCLDEMTKCLDKLDLKFNEKTHIFPIKT